MRARLALFTILACLASARVTAATVVVGTLRAGEPLTPRALCDAALAVAERRFASTPGLVRHDARCVESLRVAGAGEHAAQAGIELLAEPAALAIASGPQHLSVELREAGRPVSRAMDVELVLDVATGGWCAATALAAGERVEAGAFQRCEIALRRERDLAGAQFEPAGARMRRGVRGGEIVSARDLVPDDQQLAGDPVLVRCRAGAVVIESRGTLVQDARVGRPVRLRLTGSGHVIDGRLVAAGTVDVEISQGNP